MKRAVLLLLLLVPPVSGQARYAAVRISSHGGSGTVIETGPGRNLILTAAHLFEGPERLRRVVIDAPAPLPGTPRPGGARLVALDGALDLALVELGAGPLPYICPVAPPGHVVRGPCLSVGYDRQELPAVMRPARILATSATVTWTDTLPWYGRSGGALIDEGRGSGPLGGGGLLVGVVQGYTSVAGPRTDGGRIDRIPGEVGIYASHQAILTFLSQRRTRR